MKNKIRLGLTGLLFLLPLLCTAQSDSVRLNFNILTASENFTVETFRFYLSDFIFYQNADLIFSVNESYHLLDLAQPASLHLTFPKMSNFNKLTFNLGIDSLTNDAGARGGDLDPMHGMYWTWQSGYINVKIEGTAANCPARNGEFQFHLGGFLSDNSAMQKIKIEAKNAEEIEIELDLAAFLSQLDLTEEYRIMSPGKRAKELSEILARQFRAAR